MDRISSPITPRNFWSRFLVEFLLFSDNKIPRQKSSKVLEEVFFSHTWCMLSFLLLLPDFFSGIFNLRQQTKSLFYFRSRGKKREKEAEKKKFLFATTTNDSRANGASTWKGNWKSRIWSSGRKFLGFDCDRMWLGWLEVMKMKSWTFFSGGNKKVLWSLRPKTQRVFNLLK